jgi:hypothetical protein
MFVSAFALLHPPQRPCGDHVITNANEYSVTLITVGEIVEACLR